jgi:hypothetical protein
MKPQKWNEMDYETKHEIAIALAQSMRGQYIISQALTKAINLMKKEKYPETSNIQDMEMLRDMLFPIFFEVDKIKNKKCPKCKSKEIVSCFGGTNLKSNKNLNWICQKCLYEW